MASESRFWVFWMRKTIRKVMIVVPVLMTSCQTSENLKIGPVTAQTTISVTAAMKAQGVPVAVDTLLANLRKASDILLLPDPTLLAPASGVSLWQAYFVPHR